MSASSVAEEFRNDSDRVRSVKVRIPAPHHKLDGFELAGTLDLPAHADESTKVAMVAHCFTCTRNAPGAARISKELASNGVAVLRFDFAGLGDSIPEQDIEGGMFSRTTFSTNVKDLLAGYRWLERNYHAPILMVGHSWGGPAVIHAADNLSLIHI